MKLFECNSVSAGYNNIEIIKNIHLTIHRGDFIGIIGPNGAGKSTLLKLLARTLAPFRGTVFYKGTAINTIPLKAYAAQVSAVIDIEHVLPYSVHSFISLGLYPHTSFAGPPHDGIATVDNAMNHCAVAHIKDKKLTALSSGELQRVCIARALVQSTECILLDEPISHLDIHHAYTIMDILKGLNASGSTIVSIVHDINIASEYCSRIISIKDGAIFFDSPPEQCITYQNIESLFGCVCLVYHNPLSNKPYVYPVPKHLKKQ